MFNKKLKERIDTLEKLVENQRKLIGGVYDNYNFNEDKAFALIEEYEEVIKKPLFGDFNVILLLSGDTSIAGKRIASLPDSTDELFIGCRRTWYSLEEFKSQMLEELRYQQKRKK